MTDRPTPPVAETRPHSFTHHGITIEGPLGTGFETKNYPNCGRPRCAGVSHGRKRILRCHDVASQET